MLNRCRKRGELHESRVLIPVWHEVTFQDLVARSALLADRRALKTVDGKAGGRVDPAGDEELPSRQSSLGGAPDQEGTEGSPPWREGAVNASEP